MKMDETQHEEDCVVLVTINEVYLNRFIIINLKILNLSQYIFKQC